MKLDILLVDFGLVAAVFVPYLLFILLGQKEERALKNKFSEEVKNNQLQLDEKDSWNNNILGLDRAKGKILFVQKRKSGVAVEIIDLKEVRTCEIYREIQTVKIEDRTEEILQKLGLNLKLYSGTQKMLSLYNCEDTYSQDYELKHAEKWNRTINALIAFRPTINSAA